jgi:hypothetical protein
VLELWLVSGLDLGLGGSAAGTVLARRAVIDRARAITGAAVARSPARADRAAALIVVCITFTRANGVASALDEPGRR